MSTATRGKTTELQERTLQATQELRAALGLETITPTQAKLLTIALAEAATEEAKDNPAFVARIRSKLAELLPKPVEKKPNERKGSISAKEKSYSDLKLTPIKQVDAERLNPYGFPDPFVLLEAYGQAQLPLVLNRYSLSLLNKIAQDFQEKYPGTRPSDKRQKNAVVEYIVHQVLSQAQHY